MPARTPTFLALLSSLLAAPCIVMLAVAPLGLTSILAAAGGIWVDAHRYWFMGLSLLMLGLAVLVERRLRRTQAALAERMGMPLPENPWNRRLLWASTIVVLGLIALELSLDHHLVDGV